MRPLLFTIAIVLVTTAPVSARRTPLRSWFRTVMPRLARVYDDDVSQWSSDHQSDYHREYHSSQDSAATTRGGSNAMDVVNRKRRARGLRPISTDPAMAAAAIREASHQAATGHTGHCHPMTVAGVKSGTGYYRGGGGNLAGRFTTCYLYDRSISTGGAAIAYSADGRSAYFALMAR